MLLYSIRRCSDGKFFVHTYGNGELVMSSTPTFWRTPDSIWDNLKRVCSDFAPYRDKWGWQQKGWHNFDPRALDAWEVIVTNVSVLGETIHPARDFVTPDQIAERDVRIRKAPTA